MFSIAMLTEGAIESQIKLSAAIVLPGGSNLATARAFMAFPYCAGFSPSYRLQVSDPIEATTILMQGRRY